MMKRIPVRLVLEEDIGQRGAQYSSYSDLVAVSSTALPGAVICLSMLSTATAPVPAELIALPRPNRQGRRRLPETAHRRRSSSVWRRRLGRWSAGW